MSAFKAGQYVVWKVRFQLELESEEEGETSRWWRHEPQELRVVGGPDGEEVVTLLKLRCLSEPVAFESADGSESECRVTGWRLIFLKPVSHATLALL